MVGLAAMRQAVEATRRLSLWKRLFLEPDRLVLAILWIGLVVVAVLVRQYSGDGLRHLPAILKSGRPHLGEPRWLLFPALLFALLRPFVSVGLVTTVEGLTRPMLAFTLLFAGVYLLAVRAILVALRVPALRRAIAIVLAGVSAGFLSAATDLTEPIFAATFAAIGLAYAATRAGSSPADPRQQGKAIMIAAAAIGIASLFYQGVILAAGLIPVVVPGVTFYRKRMLVIVAAIFLVALLVTPIVLLLDGNSLRRSLVRTFKMIDNPLFREYLARPGLGKYVVALFAGPPQGVISVSDFHGMNGVVADLRSPRHRGEGIDIMTRLLVGGLLIVGGVWAAIRRRDLSLLLAFAALLIMPVILRPQQYGYIKFYILLPLLVAVAAARAPTKIALFAGLAMTLLNGTAAVSRIHQDRRLIASRSAIYANADHASCWLTTGWIPPVSFRWPGHVCAVMGTLASGAGEDPNQVLAQTRAALTACVQDCFCRSSAVYTDDMIPENAASLKQSSEYYRYDEIDLPALVARPAESQIYGDSAEGPSVFRYSPGEQRRICSVVRP